MRKKSYTARLGALALALTLVTTSLMGGTLAKYTTTVEASGSATVAKFDVTVKGNETEFGTTQTTIADLFTTGWTPSVTNGVEENMLAPGVCGYFDIVVTNNSEVLIKVSDVKIEAIPGSANVNMKYALTETNEIDKSILFGLELSELSNKVKEKFADNIGWTNGSNTKSVRVWWTWESDNDTEDTKIGAYNSDAPTYGLNLSIKTEQVMATTP